MVEEQAREVYWYGVVRGTQVGVALGAAAAFLALWLIRGYI